MCIKTSIPCYAYSFIYVTHDQSEARVVVSCFMGSYQNYHVMVGITLVKITDYSPRNKKIYNPGDNAWVAFEKESIHVL